MPFKDHEFSEEDIEQLRVSFFQYLNIAILFFALPLFIAFIINEGVVLWKIISWWNTEIDFWNQKVYFYKTLLIALFPLAYVLWFYYLFIQRVLLKIHTDYFKNWNKEIGLLIAEHLLQLKNKPKEQKDKFDLDVILDYINQKLSKFPGTLEWVARKILDQIPYIQFFHAYQSNDLNEENKEHIAMEIGKRLDKYQIDIINGLMPFWVKFIIPINVALLIWYMLS